MKFIYGGAMEEEEYEALAQLIVAADKYGLDELKKICSLAIRSTLPVKNIVDCLILADKINCPELLRDSKVLFKDLVLYLRRDQTLSPLWDKLEKAHWLLLVDTLSE